VELDISNVHLDISLYEDDDAKAEEVNPNPSVVRTSASTKKKKKPDIARTIFSY
jgi:hypothetical protein